MKKKGGQPVLSEVEELALVKCIVASSVWGYPIDSFDLRMIIHSYLEDIGKVVKKFKNNIPGIDFVYSFVKRHKRAISNRMCQNIKRSRAKICRETLSEYFDHLEKELTGIPLENIVNYDQTNLSDDPGRKKILAKRGMKYPERVMNQSKSATSIMYAATASGKLLVPYVVYKAKHLYDSWTENGPRGTRYNRTLSGWFDAVCFNDWLKTVILPYFRNCSGKKFLIGDNLSSHLSFNSVNLCMEHDIHFIFLLPNSTHISQPLDVSFFHPLKVAWRQILTLWKQSAGRQETTVPKSSFPRLLKKLQDQIFTNCESNIKAGFRAAGIAPLNREELLKKVHASEPTDATESVESNFEKFLQNLHIMSPEKTAASSNSNEPQKKTRLIVSTGESVGADDYDSDEEENLDSPDPVPTSTGTLPKKRGRKKKINTPPGKAVQPEDFIDYATLNEAVVEAPKKRGRKKKVSPAASNSEADIEIPDEVAHPDDAPVETPKTRGRKRKLDPVALNSADNANTETTNDVGSPLETADIREGQFVVARYTFETKRGRKTTTEERCFVGHVEEVFANRVQVQFLRSYKGSRTNFHYPHIPDMDYIKVKTIVKVLPTPECLRDVFYFDEAPF